MKKLAVLFMSLVLTFSLAACGNNQQANNTQASEPESGNEADAGQESSESGTSEDSELETSEASEPETSETAAAPSLESEGTGAQEGKTLVVYYSATGNTEEAANYIATATDGVLLNWLSRAL